MTEHLPLAFLMDCLAHFLLALEVNSPLLLERVIKHGVLPLAVTRMPPKFEKCSLVSMATFFGNVLMSHHGILTSSLLFYGSVICYHFEGKNSELPKFKDKSPEHSTCSASTLKPLVDPAESELKTTSHGSPFSFATTNSSPPPSPVW